MTAILNTIESSFFPNNTSEMLRKNKKARDSVYQQVRTDTARKYRTGKRKPITDRLLFFCLRGITYRQILRLAMFTALLSSAWMHGFTVSLFYSDAVHHDFSVDDFVAANAERNNKNNNNMRGSSGIDPTTSSAVIEEVDNSVHPTLYYSNSEASHSVHVVLSHCDKPVDWVWKDHLKDLSNRTTNGQRYSIKSVTILTKCGVPLARKDIPTFEAHPSGTRQQRQQQQQQQQQQRGAPPVVSVVSLPNKGRNDHSYAYWIQSIISPEDRPYQEVEHQSLREHKVLYYNYNHDGKGHDDNDNENDASDPFRRIAAGIDKRDLVFFLKDNDNQARSYDVSVPVLEMFDSTLYKDRSDNGHNISKALSDAQSFVTGFSCGQIHKQQFRTYNYTSWAHRSMAWPFYINAYVKTKEDQFGKFMCKHWPMGRWIQSLENYSFPDYSDLDFYDYDNNLMQPFIEVSEPGPPVFSGEYLERVVRPFNSSNKGPPHLTEFYLEKDLVPMCYGGVFSTLWGQLAAEDAPVTPHGWKAITHALGRDNNIEEGHYIERWWAELLGWSSYASSLHAAKSTTTTTTTTTKATAIKPTGEYLSKEEQSILLLYKRAHFKPRGTMLSPICGLITLDAKLIKNTTCCPDRTPPWQELNATAAAKR